MKFNTCRDTGKIKFDSKEAILEYVHSIKLPSYFICGSCNTFHLKNEPDMSAYESAKKFGLFD